MSTDPSTLIVHRMLRLRRVSWKGFGREAPMRLNQRSKVLETSLKSLGQNQHSNISGSRRAFGSTFSYLGVCRVTRTVMSAAISDSHENQARFDPQKIRFQALHHLKNDPH